MVTTSAQQAGVPALLLLLASGKVSAQSQALARRESINAMGIAPALSLVFDYNYNSKPVLPAHFARRDNF